MLLSEILDHLALGELDQRKITEDGCICPKYLPRVISTINLGLTELYKRFPLKQKELYIQLYPEISTYTISSKYAETNTESTADPKYILDSADEPFEDDFIKIEKIVDEGGNQVPLNDPVEQLSVYTPAYNQIQVPMPEFENQLGIVYRAKHVKLSTLITEPETVEVDLPDFLLEPLLIYVAYKLNINMDKLNGSNQGITDYQRFDSMCNSIDFYNLLPSEGIESEKFSARGYV